MIDGTATLRGLTTGTGTIYQWSEWPDGLLDTADLRTDDKPRPRRRGITPGDDLPAGKLIPFEIQIIANTVAAGEAALTLLRAAYAPSELDEWLDVRVSGEPAEYAFRGRPRGLKVIMSRDKIRLNSGGVIDARCSFMATDPVGYGPVESVSISLGTPGSSKLPFILPVVLGLGGGAGVGTATNSGTTSVDWAATLNGPLANPLLENVDTGSFIRVAATIGSGETVELDSESGSVLLNGTTPRPNWFGAGSRWFRLPPGPTSLRLVADSGTGTADVVWRPGWN